MKLSMVRSLKQTSYRGVVRLLCGVQTKLGLKFLTALAQLLEHKPSSRRDNGKKLNHATPLPGDIVFFDFPNDGVDRISHVGIVVRDNGDGTVICVEGNTAPDKKGDQRNGGQVCLKKRAYKAKNGPALKKSLPVYIVGFGKPVFKS
jgi:hypothetical protein